jgi:hypothetical protein
MGWRAASRAWLSLTPEPERDLPRALATLRAQGPPSDAAVAAEHDRAQELILHGSQQTWLAWLHEALELAEPEPVAGSPAMARARAVVLDVIENHHGLLQGLPGDAAAAEADRRRLDALLARSAGDPARAPG